MAQIIPSDFAQFQRSGWHVPETETLNTLRARLPPDYTVFHGVHWTREGFRTTAFGELDFVIVNRAGHALMVEPIWPETLATMMCLAFLPHGKYT